MVIDDDENSVKFLTAVLEENGYETAVAYDGREGVEKLKKDKADLLILDVMMEQPDDGLAMARDLRKGGFAAPILMLTSLSKITGMDYGADEELVPVDAFEEKPIAPANLVARVQELLGR